MWKKDDIDTFRQTVAEVVASILSEKKEEIKAELKVEIISEVTVQLKEQMKNDYARTVKDETKHLNENLQSVEYDLEYLKEDVKAYQNEITNLKEDLLKYKENANEALKMANFNEQYSLKHNIKVFNLPEANNENIEKIFCTTIQQKIGLTVKTEDIQAIHRLPKRSGKDTHKSIIVKFYSSGIKQKLLRKKKELKEKHSIICTEDVTAKNIGLINRLSRHPQINYAWYYNGHVYATPIDLICQIRSRNKGRNSGNNNENRWFSNSSELFLI